PKGKYQSTVVTSALMAVYGRVGKWVPIGTSMNRQSPNDTDAAAGYRAGNLL
ncbi:hypothetical protein HMPREF1553_00477, partial [Porphyromonas gingivalis F0568]